MNGLTRAVPERLFHYTDRRGAIGILYDGAIVPSPFDGVIWLTDLDTPAREALGLTMVYTPEDRTKFRFEVPVDLNSRSGIVHYLDARDAALPIGWCRKLEAAPGAMPMHWYVATASVRTFGAPIEFGATLRAWKR